MMFFSASTDCDLQAALEGFVHWSQHVQGWVRQRLWAAKWWMYLQIGNKLLANVKEFKCCLVNEHQQNGEQVQWMDLLQQESNQFMFPLPFMIKWASTVRCLGSNIACFHQHGTGYVPFWPPKYESFWAFLPELNCFGPKKVGSQLES